MKFSQVNKIPQSSQNPQSGQNTQSSQTSRRSFIATSSAIVAAGSVALSNRTFAADETAAKPFKLPPLPYAYDALAPSIDAETMKIHYTKHHQGYVDKLNAAVSGKPELAGKTVEELLTNLDSLPKDVRMAIRNNGGGHANHTLFWTILRPISGSSTISADLTAAIDSSFGSLDKFKEEFATAAAKRFGSGWAWLVKSDKGLEVVSTPNQDSPITMGKKPLLGLDVWEHAYYLNYQNRRPEYIEAFWTVVNWNQVSKNFVAA